MEKLISRFEKSLRDTGVFSLVSEARKIIVAYSGGADSTLLLHLTSHYFTPRGVAVEAAHLNHMIRGGEADRDENFCALSAEKLGIKLNLKRVDIPSLSAEGGSVEEVARRERYAFFEELCRENEENHIKTLVFTAHNADDNLETVLFNLVRGSALRGMCGIPPVRDGKYVRPILSFTGEEIRAVCGEYNIPYVNDSTNFETDYTRNYIRHHITPRLAEIVQTPQISALRMSQSLRCDEEYLDAEASKILTHDGTAVPNNRLRELHDAVLSRVLVKMYSRCTAGDIRRPHIEKVHISDIITHLRGSDKPFSLSVPGNVVFISDGAVSRFAVSGEKVDAPVDKAAETLEIDTPVTKNGYTVILTRDVHGKLKEMDENIYNLSIHKAFNFDKIKGKLKIRTRSEGDAFRFGGMTRKVKKLFSDRKLSVRERETLPVIFDECGIVWIPGFPVRDDLKPCSAENTLHLICFSGGKER